MKKIISVILAMIMILSAMPFSVFAEEVSSLSYEFTGVNKDDPGYAEGTLTFYAASAAEYYLYWGDEEKALPQYFEITSFTAEEGSTYTYKFPAQVAIPADAECVFVSKAGDCDSAFVSENIAKFDIPDSKKLMDSSSERQYRYAAFSDIHIDRQYGSRAGYFTNSADHWAQALDVCVDREVDFIISAGDQVTNASGSTMEWLTYQQILAESDYVNPIYEADGNHEPRASENFGCDVACSNEEYSLATGLDADSQSVLDGKDYYEVTEPNTGDHFIFMSEVSSSPNQNDNFSKEQLDWLEGLLAKYKGDGKKIFLIEHALIQGYGAGDDTYDPGYKGGIRLTDEDTGAAFPNNQRFKAILEANKEIIWYSGHTHLDFTENQNYSSENGTSCHMVHIPSVCNTTSYKKDENGYKILGTDTDYTFYDDTTQGYFVDVFEGATVLYGTNLHYNKVYPRYTYLIEEKEPDVRPTEETQPRPTAPVPTQPEIEGGKKVYCINSANWAEVYAHSWGAGTQTTTWPGYPMAKTGETVNGFDVYEATVEADYTGIIFNNNNKGSKTLDLEIQEGQYFDIRSGAWYSSLADVPELDTLSTDRYLVGSFNSWSTIANEFKLKAEGDSTAYVTIPLAANTTYQFKVIREGKWTSNITPITGDVEDLVFSSSVKNNATITTTVAGDYVFSFGISSSALGVKYPEAQSTEPSESTEPFEPTTPVEPTVYGDTDGNGTVDVTDATLLQRAVAKLVTLDEKQKACSDVDGDGDATVLDATLIQKKVAKLIDKFPVEKTQVEEKGVAVTGDSTLTSEELFTKAQEYLKAYFQYASYNDYQALKKVVYKYKDGDVTALSSEAMDEITQAIAVFDALRAKVHQMTVYYTDGEAFGNIRAYYFNSATGAEIEEWPGQIGSYMRTNSYGQNIYAVTLNFSKYDTIVFSGGTNKTVDISLNGESGRLYYPTTQDTAGEWEVSQLTFKQMWYSDTKEEEVGDEVLEEITIYFTDTLGWTDVNCYYWFGGYNNVWPGEKMTFVEYNSQNQPVYSIKVPAGSGVVFNNGAGSAQSIDITGVTNGYGYYLTTLSSGKYLYESYKYGE